MHTYTHTFVHANRKWKTHLQGKVINFKQPPENALNFTNNLVLLSKSEVKYSVKNIPLYFEVWSLWGLVEKAKLLPPASYLLHLAPSHAASPTSQISVPSLPLVQGFSSWHWRCWAYISPCRGARWSCPGHCRLFSRIPGLYPPDASSTPSLSHNNQRCLQTWSPLENHCTHMAILWGGPGCIIQNVRILFPSSRVQCRTRLGQGVHQAHTP